MSCDKSHCDGTCGVGHTSGQTTCYTCSPCAAKRTRERLKALYACEPFCALPGCAPPACKTACNASGRRGCTIGANFYELDAVDCAVFGPHGNCERRLSSLAPQDVENIIDSFSPPEFVSGQAVNVTGTWWALTLGSLGVSHVFCLLEYAVFGVNLAGDIPLTASAAGVAGLRQACADPPNTGSRAWYVDRLCRAEPGADITDNRCRCVNPPCAATPAGGGEVVMVDLGFTQGNLPPDVTAVRVEALLSRCDWLLCVDTTVCSPGNRLPASPGQGFPNATLLRVTPGNIPFAP